MISDSEPWKKELGRFAGAIRELRRSPEWTETYSFRVEKAVMLGFFIIRRLIESSKLTEEVMAHELRTIRYPNLGSVPDLMNWQELDRHFNFEAASPRRVPLKQFYNQAIHSFVFIPYRGGRGAAGVFVASDWERKRALHRVTLTEIERLFRKVATDQPVRMNMLRKDDGQFEVFLSSKRLKRPHLGSVSRRDRSKIHR